MENKKIDECDIELELPDNIIRVIGLITETKEDYQIILKPKSRFDSSHE